MKDTLQQIIARSIKQAFEIEPPNFSIEIPQNKDFGDFSTNTAMLLSKPLKRSPKVIAETLIKAIRENDKEGFLSEISIAGPGFINMKISLSWLQAQLLRIVEEDSAFGKSKKFFGKKALLEFVSANPTGPLHIGHGRWAVLGDNIANLLSAAGYSVSREFYVNDVGNQVEMLMMSVRAAIKNEPTPENGYGGAYIKELAKDFTNDSLSAEKLLKDITSQQEQVLEKLGVQFDAWFSEKTLHDQNKVLSAVEKLKQRHETYEKDGSIWFKSESHGDDKDRVLVRDNGIPTYFAADIAYHQDKFGRGFDRIINIWGTDHHGYVKRLQVAMAALGLDNSKLEILIGQLVSLFRAGEQVRMSKRTGEMVTLEEVLDEIGKDATRFFFTMTDEHSHMNFDLELAKSKTDENPVYYVQYAHARIYSIMAEAKKRGIEIDIKKTDPKLLTEPSERELMRLLLSLPDEVMIAAEFMAPHRLATYARELATVFHSFYQKCRVISEDKYLTSARMLLVESTRTVLANVLKLLGIDAPERM